MEFGKIYQIVSSRKSICSTPNPKFFLLLSLRFLLSCTSLIVPGTPITLIIIIIIIIVLIY